MTRTSSTVSVVCRDCGKGKRRKLNEISVLMNKIKFETCDSMDDQASTSGLRGVEEEQELEARVTLDNDWHCLKIFFLR
ncbi:hypothetical protein Tco_0926408 [Tanacetum coccineum]|uniref:Uncharacterized protein n=1 Tax=Tanacetum coccineum TaxID=301880 RepID=A0ABQ5DAM1_9ASTR